MLRGEDTKRDTFLGFGVDLSELLFHLSGVQLFAVNLMVHFEELIFADYNNEGILFEVILDGVIGGFRGDTTTVEHPLVT